MTNIDSEPARASAQLRVAIERRQIAEAARNTTITAAETAMRPVIAALANDLRRERKAHAQTRQRLAETEAELAALRGGR